MSRLHRVPPAPEVMAMLYAEYLRTEKCQGLSFRQYLEVVGYTNPSPGIEGLDDGRVLHSSAEGPELISIPNQQISGLLRVKVLLIDFEDREGFMRQQHYEDLLFSKNTYPTGSMRDYYHEVSLGKVDITGSVHGWIRMPRPYAYYNNNESGQEWSSYPRNAQRMAEDAVNAAIEEGVEFEPELDKLNQGVVTALFIIHAGRGAEVLPRSIRKREMWSHKWSMRRPVDVATNMEASIYLTVPHDCKIGVCAHELGHLAFQWDDFYDPNYAEDGKEWSGSGKWDLMAGGSHNDGGTSPAHPAGLHKSQHGWIEQEMITTSTTVTLKPYTSTSGKVAKIVSPRYKQKQYLILENRVRNNFDTHLPGEGLLVWRVDESGEMYAPDTPGLLLVQADGKHELEKNWDQGDGGDPFPGNTGRAQLGDTGNISTSFPEQDRSGVSLSNIRRDPNTDDITLDVKFEMDGVEQPTVASGEAVPYLQIPDDTPIGVSSAISFDHSGTAKSIKVSIDIEHTYIGDLRVELVAPSGQKVILHDEEGGYQRNIIKTYDSTSILSDLVGQQVKGNWILRVTDLVWRDVGTLRKWKIEIDIEAGTQVIHGESTPELNIPDRNPTGVSDAIFMNKSGEVREAKVNVNIEHTYIGDLQVALVAPSGRQAILHNKTGGDQRNITATYDSVMTQSLAGLIGEQVKGNWILRVIDLEWRDVGTLKEWSLEFGYAS